MEEKKAQLTGIAIFLIVVVLLFLAVILTYVVIKTHIISINTAPTWGNQQPQVIQVVKEPVKEKEEVVCYSPFIKIGGVCCIDQNINGICDNYEQPVAKPVPVNQYYQNNQYQEQTNTCYRPYMQRGSSCCLDNNYNGRCDDEDGYYNDRYSSSSDRYDVYLSSPLDVKDFDISSHDLTLDIKNTGDNDITITSIDVSDCDRIHPDQIIKKDDRESFDFSCDFPSRISSNIDVDYTYTVGNSTETKSTSGRIRENSDYNRISCDPRYEPCNY